MTLWWRYSKKILQFIDHYIDVNGSSIVDMESFPAICGIPTHTRTRGGYRSEKSDRL